MSRNSITAEHADFQAIERGGFGAISIVPRILGRSDSANGRDQAGGGVSSPRA